MTVTRKTDSFTEWLGGCGGFMKALNIVSRAIVFSYNNFALQSTLVLKLVRFVPI